ncbi:MAG: tetratricopeptide repeat protein, partial [Candidatus Kapaibacterium sp.]
QEDPEDPFSRYALALELATEESGRAIGLLLSLLKENPSYVPSYYQASLLLLEQNQLEETKIILEKGIKIARQQNDLKAATELKQLLDELD